MTNIAKLRVAILPATTTFGRKLNTSCRRKIRRGSTLILIVTLMVVIVAAAAFAVDFGRMQLVRSQLQTAVDAGALAGSLQLKQDPADVEAARTAARDFISRNRVGFNVTVPAEAMAVEVGGWDADNHTFDAAAVERNAVSVRATQANEPFLFARMFGQTSFSIPRSSVAVAGAAKLEIIMVLDLSGSMEEDGRIEALQEAAPVFVDAIGQGDQDDRIGVMCYGVCKGSYDPIAEGHQGVVYAATPAAYFPDGSDFANDWVGILEGPLTTDFAALHSSVLTTDALVAGKYGGGTPTGAALRDAVHYLDSQARENSSRLLVLMSDGLANKPNSDADGYALKMASYAKASQITIYTISLGNDADLQLMENIASATGGKHYSATGAGDELATMLKNAFRHVAGEITRTTVVQ